MSGSPSLTARGQRSKKIGNADQVKTGMLLNSGIIKTSASGGLELTDDVVYSLLLGDE